MSIICHNSSNALFSSGSVKSVDCDDGYVVVSLAYDFVVFFVLIIVVVFVGDTCWVLFGLVCLTSGFTIVVVVILFLWLLSVKLLYGLVEVRWVVVLLVELAR